MAGAPLISAEAALFTWNNTTGTWSQASNWTPPLAPSGTDPTDILTFGGNVATPYVSTNNLGANPAILNQFIFAAQDPTSTGGVQIIAGNPVALAAPTGGLARITQNGSGDITINTPIQLRAPLLLEGNGTNPAGGGATVTLNNTLSGAFDIRKTGLSTFRFGTQTLVGPPEVELPSSNTWFGTLTIDGGTIRFNNNAASGRTALRGNPAVLTSAGSALTVASELRVGTLSGPAGVVTSQVTGNNTDNASIVIHALTDGTYGGSLTLGGPTGSGASDGVLVVRGAATQTLTGALNIRKDVSIGRGATLVLGGNASLAGQASGAIVMNGGTFRMDNTVTNADRLRTGNADSTGLDTIGGGTFSLVGNSAGTTEVLGRLQLGSVNQSLTTNKPRSGALKVNLVHNGVRTILNFMAYTRDARTLEQYTTVDFSVTNNTGFPATLGQTGDGPRVTFQGSGFAVSTLNQLINNTDAGVGTPPGQSDTGWATVNGTDFATYSLVTDGGLHRGVQAVVTVPFPASPGNSATNAALIANATISGSSSFALNSLKIAPTAPGGHLDITGSGALNNKNFLLAGPHDYTIQNTGSGTGGITGPGSRYFHVQEATLNIDVPLTGAASRAIVKAGGGTLSLLRNNNAVTAPLVINEGAVRSSIANLPAGEMRLRGGVYEISGGGTFSRPLSFGSNSVNWSGIDPVTAGNPAIDEDRGSGGFAAVGGNAVVDLGALGATPVAWEDKGFVNSAHALVFGSRNANSRIEFADQLSLSPTQGIVNYNAREIRVNDNPAVATDVARFTAPVSGTVQNDLLKTGAGTLELTARNTYTGATQVQEGTLLVNVVNQDPNFRASIASSFLTAVRNSGTLGGDGTIGALRVEAGGTIAPSSAASSTGILSTSTLTFLGTGARLSIELGGTVPGSSFDQVSVTGALALNGAELVGSLLNNFAAAETDRFFIILNDGVDAVEGTFAQGSAVTFDTQTFGISYAGDSGTNSLTGGNDVVLFLIPEPMSGVLTLAGAGLLLGLRRRRSNT